MFEQEVETGNGVVKRVVAQSEAELKAAVDVARNEVSAPSQDIHNGNHGNMTDAEFAEFVAAEKLKAKKVKEDK